MSRVLVLTLLACLSLAAQDRIDRVGGESLIDVKITKETFKRITFERANGAPSASVATSEVVEITRGGMPSALREGRALLLSGDAGNAARLLDGVTRASGVEDWVKEYASFWLAKAQLAIGDHQKAASSAEKVIGLNAESRFLPEVRLLLIDAAVASGDHAKASNLVDALAKEAKEKSFAPLSAIEGRRRLGRSLAAQQKWADAVRAYESALREVTTMAEAAQGQDKKALLELGVLLELDAGQAMIRANRATEASQVFAGITRKYRDVRGAEAVAAIGGAAVELSKGESDRARVMLTQALAVHFDQPALRPLALLLLAETHLARDKAGEPEARLRAKDALTRLTTRHAGTPEALLGLEMLKKL